MTLPGEITTRSRLLVSTTQPFGPVLTLPKFATLLPVLAGCQLSAAAGPGVIRERPLIWAMRQIRSAAAETNWLSGLSSATTWAASSARTWRPSSSTGMPTPKSINMATRDANQFLNARPVS